jgi:hypothetical protein
MPRPSSDYSTCPNCHRRTVLFFFAPKGEDFLRCTRCRWETWRYSDSYSSPSDDEQLEKWQRVNSASE